MRVIEDLCKKAVDDISRVMSTTIDLAGMIGGPSAISSLLLHVAGSQMSTLASCMVAFRERERDLPRRENYASSHDDFLAACLLVFGGYVEPGKAAEIATETFRQLKQRDPDYPAAWRLCSTPGR